MSCKLEIILTITLKTWLHKFYKSFKALIASLWHVFLVQVHSVVSAAHECLTIQCAYILPIHKRAIFSIRRIILFLVHPEFIWESQRWILHDHVCTSGRCNSCCCHNSLSHPGKNLPCILAVNLAQRTNVSHLSTFICNFVGTYY